MSPTALLACRDIAFERDDYPLFSGVSLSVSAGQAVQIRGANGVGKTTLLRILATSLTPSAGEVFWKGKPLERVVQDYRSSLLYLGHDPAVKLDLSPLENLQWFFQLFPGNGLDGETALARVGLTENRDVPCRTLSAGQLRRVALARLHMAAAQLWILDEPFTAIDVGGVGDVERLMAEHLARGGMLLTTSHQALSLDGLAVIDLEPYAH